MNYLSSLLSMRRITSNHIDSLLLRAEHNQQEHVRLTEELLTPFAFASNPVKDRREKILTIQEVMSIHALNIHECTQAIETILQPRMEEIDKILSIRPPATSIAAEYLAGTGRRSLASKLKCWMSMSFKLGAGKLKKVWLKRSMTSWKKRRLLCKLPKIL